MQEQDTIPYGYCHCGCGQKSPLAKMTSRKRGWVAGEPCRYIHGHNGRTDWDKPRICKTCGELTEPTGFYKGRQDCKPCAIKSQRGRKRSKPDPDKAREWARVSYQRNRDRRLEGVRQWQADNPDRVREIKRLAAARRYARQLNQFVEDIDIATLILRDEGRCGICGSDLEGPDFHIDHIFPLSRGGEHSMRNVQLAHPVCNVRKGASVGTDIR